MLCQSNLSSNSAIDRSYQEEDQAYNASWQKATFVAQRRIYVLQKPNGCSYSGVPLGYLIYAQGFAG